MLLRMDVLTSETCWALNKVILKQVASSLSLFTQICHNVRFTHSGVQEIPDIADRIKESAKSGNKLLV